MSSQKYAVKEMNGFGAYYWRCKITRYECTNTSYSTRNPVCERCRVRKSKITTRNKNIPFNEEKLTGNRKQEE